MVSNVGKRVLDPRASLLMAGALLLAGAAVQGQTRGIEPAPAQVKVVHGSSDAPPVDVYYDGTRVLAGVPFPAASGYLEVPAGLAPFAVTAANEPIENAVITVGPVLDAGQAYTVIAYDALAEIKPLLLADNLTAPADATQSRVRAVHAAVGVGEVDILVQAGDQPFSPLYSDVPFGAAGDALEVPSVEYTIGLDLDNDGEPNVTFDPVTPPAGVLVDIIALTDADGPFLFVVINDGTPTTVSLRPQAGTVPTANLRAIHLFDGGPAVDVYGNETLLVGSLPFGSGTGYAEVPAVLTDLAITLPGDNPTSEALLLVPDVPLEENLSYTAAAWNNGGSLSALLLQDNEAPTTNTRVAIRAIHAGNGIPTVDAYAAPFASELGILATLAPGAFTSFLDLPPAEYIIGLDTGRNQTPDIFFNLPPVTGGTVANVFAVNDQGTTPTLFVQLNDADGTVVPVTPFEASTLRALHLSPDAPAVDIWSGGGPTGIAGLEFTEGTASVPLYAGMYDFQVVPAGGTDADSVLDINDVTLLPGMAYTAAVYDSVSTPSALLLVDDFSPIEGMNIRVRVAHTAIGVGQVDVLALSDEGNSVLFGDLDYGSATDVAVLPAGAYKVGIDVDNDLNPELRFDIPELETGTIANVFAVADADGVFLLAQLNGSTTVRLDPQPIPVGNRLAFNFEAGAENWTFASPEVFSPSTGEAAGGQLAITAADNSNSFAFWESPRLSVAAGSIEEHQHEEVMGVRGDSGPGSLYMAEFLVKSEFPTANEIPDVRVRASSFDFQQADVLVISSVENADLSPTSEGQLYRSFFTLPAEETDFRLNFDMLNFDADNATSVTVALDSASLEFLGTAMLMNEATVASFDLTTTETVGFVERTAPPLVAANFEATSAGLTLRYTGEPLAQNESAFGFWFLETEVPFEGGKLYRVRWTVGSEATDANAEDLGTFRLRINDSSFKTSMYVNVDSSTAHARVPVNGEPQVYDLYFQAPAEIDGDNWLFSFDYLLTGDTANDGSIGVSLQGLEITSYDLMMSAQ